jgi:competence protein ComEC
MKVSHHGSADQSSQLIQELHPKLATVSVGRGNAYGHPTKRTLDLLASFDCAIERTDEHGSISVAIDRQGFELGFQGEQGKTG